MFVIVEHLSMGQLHVHVILCQVLFSIVLYACMYICVALRNAVYVRWVGYMAPS